ncbi:flagellar biosynthetic protein FliR [Zobellella maritima]|uniref:flagellar biosynthetic protein FliR n=1 Tax=Zobellella maritima TaxID=2059725 RepID=UPI000E306EC3|nr:flagellar biosynthetic protein FliR [Zobellella maritima]
MLEVTFTQLQGWLVAFFWPFIRLGAFLVAAPLLGHTSIPNRVKIGLAALLTLVVAPGLPAPPDIPMMSWAGLGIVVEQMLIGLAMGLTMHILFAVVTAAGEYIGLQMGLGFATFFAPDTGANTMVLSRLLHMISLLLFLAFDGHLMVIEILAGTFVILPVGISGLNTNAFELLARFASTIFVSGLLLALPLVSALLIINLSLGILNRASPQLTVFSIGFPLTMLVGLVLLMVMMTDLGRFMQRLFGQGMAFLQQLVQTMVPL